MSEQSAAAGASPEARLRELGLALPPVAAPLAAYVPAVRVGDLVFTSGQLPLVDGELPVSGPVGAGPDAKVIPETATELARRCALNALA
ncbi:MAG: RidA family protein, partial [Actinomycetota bacterium]|nr:RidA family protein [Actinomycetota bacterium]